VLDQVAGGECADLLVVKRELVNEVEQVQVLDEREAGQVRLQTDALSRLEASS
jgi:hypothetical protein